MVVKPFSAECVDSLFGMEQVLCCSASCGENERRLQGMNLCFQKTLARGGFVRHRRAVHWRAAFYDICDIAVARAVESNCGEHFIKQLPGFADKRASRIVFFFTGTFANHHDAGMRDTFPRNDVFTCLCKNAVST